MGIMGMIGVTIGALTISFLVALAVGDLFHRQPEPDSYEFEDWS